MSQFIFTLLICATVLAIPPTAVTAQNNIDEKVLAMGGLESLDPFNPDPLAYERFRSQLNGPEDILAIVNYLWVHYNTTGQPRYGDWALQWGYMWWQTLPPGKPRVDSAMTGQKLARKFIRDHPQHPAGHFWYALYYGSEGIARGVLNALSMLPSFREILEAVEKKSPDYFFGTVSLIKAKMYIKLPPFPLSFGDVDKGIELIESGAERQRRIMALWHINNAEAQMLQHGKDEALAALDGIKEICPDSLLAAYNYQMGMFLAEQFREAIHSGTYNKYTWDPLLESIDDLLTKSYPPPEACG